MLLRVLLLVIIIPLSFKSLALIEVEGLSPSFPRQQLSDPLNDLKYYPLFPKSNCTEIRQSVQFPEIEAVSYFSDGNFLNATIWLSGPFEESPVSIVSIPTYFMNIGIIHPQDLKLKNDYSVSVQWNISTWTKTLREFSINGTRTLEDNKHSHFFDNTEDKGHVDLSLDLRKIASPNQYFASFGTLYSAMKKGNACGLVDVLDHVGYIPPPKFSLSTFPSLLEIKQGEEKTIELRINSSTLAKAVVDVKPALERVPVGVDVSILTKNPIKVPPAGIAPSRIKITVSDNVAEGPYTVPIISNMSFPATVTLDVNPFIKRTSNTTDGSRGLYIPQNTASSLEELRGPITAGPITAPSLSQESSVPVHVEEYPFPAKFKDFWSVYGDIISLIGGGFAAGLSALLIDRFRTRSRHKSGKIDDYLE
jgi:hypothetical protein